MAMNCTDLRDGEPCGECADCRGIREGRHLDVLEIDSGRFRGIDDIKSLSYKALFAPMSRRKVWIFDECQQLTADAWGALLKLLEEPPPLADKIKLKNDWDKCKGGRRGYRARTPRAIRV